MCRGCTIKLNGRDDCCEEYLSWLGKYQRVISDMKKIERELSGFIDSMDDKEQKAKVDIFRRALMKQRKGYSKATEYLKGI